MSRARAPIERVALGREGADRGEWSDTQGPAGALHGRRRCCPMRSDRPYPRLVCLATVSAARRLTLPRSPAEIRHPARTAAAAAAAAAAAGETCPAQGETTATKERRRETERDERRQGERRTKPQSETEETHQQQPPGRAAEERVSESLSRRKRGNLPGLARSHRASPRKRTARTSC